MSGGRDKDCGGEVTIHREIDGDLFEWKVMLGIGFLGLSQVVHMRAVHRVMENDWVLESGEPELLAILLQSYILGNERIAASKVLEVFPEGNSVEGLQLLIMNLELVFGPDFIQYEAGNSNSKQQEAKLGYFCINQDANLAWLKGSNGDDALAKAGQSNANHFPTHTDPDLAVLPKSYSDSRPRKTDPNKLFLEVAHPAKRRLQ